MCNAGPARLRPHRAIQRRLGQLLVASGASVDYERPVTDFYKLAEDGTIQEAILDLVVTYPAAIGYHAIDVSIRAPQATRYAVSSFKRGEAAATGAVQVVSR